MTTALEAAKERLREAIIEREQELVELLQALVRQPSTLGNEAGAQEVVANYLREGGIEPDVWEIDEADLRSKARAANTGVPYAGRPNVAGTLRGVGGGQSLILNGHIDVVPVEPISDWSYDPWGAEIVGGRMYGRGADDMKSGVAVNLFITRLIKELGIQLQGDLIVQSVIEEESGGNGALSAALRYQADGALVTENMGEEYMLSEMGPFWFDITVTGLSEHAANAHKGVNAIEKMVPIMAALRELEAEFDANRHPDFADFEHPANLNFGIIQAGDWRSVVPRECKLGCRFAYFPGTTWEEMDARLRATIDKVAQADPWLREHPPVISYTGLNAEPSTISVDSPIIQTLSAAYKAETGEPIYGSHATGTTDARFFRNVSKIPATCFGTIGQNCHAANEWVELDSLHRVARVVGAFTLDWCGVADE
jgi:acetylornithine deacetylase